MPVYLSPATLIVEKGAIAQKYTGGVEKFRKDYLIDGPEANQEDDQVFALGKMNVDEFDIETLMSRGLDFEVDKQHSTDFVIVYRYGGALWEVDWLRENRVFAWHKNASQTTRERVDEISQMTMDELNQLFEKGENPFQAIR